ncbi:MAG: DUF503 domain-containing protein [Phycisphaerae bacterium]|nr:DUF503 domain-containing protein [Phycisphaerae bacterium]
MRVVLMVIGVLQFELTIPHSQSLKDKRRVVKSLKDRLHREHMVSIAEISALDEHRTAVMALTLVSNSAPHASETLDRVIEKLRSIPEARLGSVTRELIHESELDWHEAEHPEAAAEWDREVGRMAAEAERALREVDP